MRSNITTASVVYILACLICLCFFWLFIIGFECVVQFMLDSFPIYFFCMFLKVFLSVSIQSVCWLKFVRLKVWIILKWFPFSVNLIWLWFQCLIIDIHFKRNISLHSDNTFGEINMRTVVILLCNISSNFHSIFTVFICTVFSKNVWPDHYIQIIVQYNMLTIYNNTSISSMIARTRITFIT